MNKSAVGRYHGAVKSTLQPPVRKAQVPPFHEIAWDDFEVLTTELVGFEPDIVTSQRHGLPGRVSDRGADVLALRRDGAHEVASCKRYSRMSVAKLKTWCDEFLDHWESYWHEKEIRRFVLATSARNVDAIDIIERALKERKRFAALGISFEIWGPAQIASRLRPHRLTAQVFLTSAWADHICGPVEPPAAPVSERTSAVSFDLIAQLHDLQQRLSGAAIRQAEDAVEPLRRGHLDRVDTLIAHLRQPASWAQLDARARAAVERLAGSLALQRHDIDAAERHCRAADSEAPADEPRLAARIAVERAGPQAALAILGEPVSTAGRQLAISLLLGSGDAVRQRIDALLAEDPADAETLRLHALERLIRNDRDGALQIIEQAEQRAGDWLAIKRAGVAIRYARALSPALGASFTLSPNPMMVSLVRTDEAARASLAKALDTIDAIIAVGQLGLEDRLWRLAILANLPDREADAAACARDILDRDPGEPTTIAWILQRDLPVDLSAALDCVRARYAEGTEIGDARVLILSALDGRQAERTRSCLADHLDRQSPEVRDEITHFLDQLAGRSRDEDAMAFHALVDDGDDAAMRARLAERFDADPPAPDGIFLAEQLAAANQWQVLVPHARKLLAYRTAAALRLAVHIAAHAGDFRLLVDLLDEHGWLFGPALPADMQRLRADALSRLGRVTEALRQANLLASHSPAIRDQLFNAELYARIGEVRRAVPLLRQALAEDAIDPSRALQWSRLLERDEPELARELARAAATGPLDDALVGAAAERAMRLGLDREFSKLVPRLQTQSAAGTTGFRLMSIEDIQAFAAEASANNSVNEELFNSGAIPIHLLVAGDAERLLRYAAGADPASAAPLEARPIRHGGRPEEPVSEWPWRDWRICLDVTALFTAERLGLLDRLEAHPNGLTVSPHLAAILQEMQLLGAAPPSAELRTIEGLIGQDRVLLSDRPGFRGLCFGDPADSREEIEQATRALAARLVAAGRLSAADSERLGPSAPEHSDHGALTELGNDNAPEAFPDGVLVTPGVLMLLARADLLARVGAEVELHLDRLERNAISDALAEEANARHLGQLAAHLLARVATGVQGGRYHMLPIRDYDEAEADAISGQLMDLLALPPTEGGVVWFDDRNLNGYVHADRHLIIGSWEMLAAMEADGALVPADADRMRCELHASGALCLPFAADRIVDLLCQASVARGAVVETRDLSVMRRSFAAAQSFARHLKVGPATGPLADRPEEDVAARGYLRLMSEALAKLWTIEDMSHDDRIARADWLWSNLRCLRLDPAGTPEDPVRWRDQVLTMQIAHCLENGQEIGGEKDERKPLRLSYLHWCWDRMAVPRMAADNGFFDRLVDYLTIFYRSLLEDRDELGDKEQLVLEHLLLRRVDRLPDPLAERLRQSGLFARMVTLVRRVTLAGAQFEPGPLWRAAGTALRGGKASTRTLDGGKVELRREGQAILLSGACTGRVEDELFAILAVTGKARAQAIDRFAALYPASTAAKLAWPTSKAADAALVEQLFDRRNASVEDRTRRVELSLDSDRGASIEDLAPGSVEDLLIYYAIDPAQPVDQRFATAFATLSDRIGPEAALGRLQYLPVAALWETCPLPSAETLAGHRQQASTPIGVTTLGILSRRAESHGSSLAEMAGRLLAACERWGKAWRPVVEWTRGRLAADDAWYALDPATRYALTWLHAGWLIDQFARRDFAPETLIEGISDVGGEEVIHAAPHVVGPLDQADPAGLNPEALLAHGLRAMLADGDLALLDPDQRAAIAQLLKAPGTERMLPSINLLLRRSDGPDALNSFLYGLPAGLFTEPPEVLRDDTLMDFLAMARTQGGDRSAWNGLGIFASRGMTDAQAQAFATLLGDTDLFGLAGPDEEGADFAIWRRLVPPLAATRPEELQQQLRRLATCCAQAFGGRLQPGGKGAGAFAELCETALAAACWSTGPFDDALFAAALTAIIEGWPDCAPSMRAVMAHLLANLSPNRGAALWILDRNLRRKA
ncbi:hypothetical protein HY78_02140 [Rhizorhabdus wittichii DC-6]|nr:hypothetical protein HY78_02140 [Rhizorhabdus wittichii DC-6]